MKLTINGKYDITEFAKSIKWSGDAGQIARSLNAELAPGVSVEAGDDVRLYDSEGKELFSGIAMQAAYTGNGSSFGATDYGVYLANNSVYREYNDTPYAIAKAICAQMDVKLDTKERLAERRLVQAMGKSAAAAIMEAYEGEGNAKPKYCFYMNGKELRVEKRGSQLAAHLQEEIESAERSEDIQSMVNRVIILDQNGKRRLKPEDNAADRRKYGTFQQVYRQEKGKKASVEAREMLQGKEKKGSISGQGDTRCVAGRAVQVTEPRSGLKGTYIIQSDSHTFTPTGHTMLLELRDE